MKIKSCPFCGGMGIPDQIIRNGYEGKYENDPDSYAYFIRCISCAAEGGWAKSLSGAIHHWNWRVKKKNNLEQGEEDEIH